MAFQIVRVWHYDGEMIGTSTRHALPNVYETSALPWKLAGRMAEDDCGDASYYVCVAGDMRPLAPPPSRTDADEIPW